MRSHARIFVCLVALGIGAVGGCKTDTPGVKNVAGTYTATIDAPPDRVTNAARAAVEQLGLRDIKSNPTKVDGWVTAKTANNEPINIDVSQDGANRSKVSIRVGVVGDDSISKRIYEKIRDNL